MKKLSIRSRLLATVTLVVLVLAIAVFASGATAFAANTPTSSAKVTIAPGGWVAYTFNFAGPGNHVALLLEYNPVAGLSQVDKYISMDVYQPKDSYRNSIGSASFVREGLFLYDLNSPMPRQGDHNRIKKGDLDPAAPAGTYQVVIHNWNTDHALTVRLSSAYVTKVVDEQRNQENVKSRSNTGYFVYGGQDGPKLLQVSKSE